MRAAFTLAALAGSALALPGYGNGYPAKEVKNVHVVVETVVKTVYVTEGYEVPKPTSSPKPVYDSPSTTTVVYEEPAVPTSKYEEPAAPTSKYEEPAAPTSKYEYPVVTPTPAPIPTPTPTPETPAPVSSAAPAPVSSAAPAPTASGYMAVVDEWRAKLGLSQLICDSMLEANALDTVVSSNGEMVHKLNPGTYGQTLAPGDDNVTSFEKVFVGGWLCEIPTLAGLDGICDTMSQGWSYEGQTGHAEILTSPSYSKIGCGWYAGIWGCDFA